MVGAKRFFGILTVLLTLSSSMMHAQFARVIATKGDVQIVNGMDVRTPFSGMTLKGEEAVLLGQEGYIGIVDKHGRTVELRGEGQYDLTSMLEIQDKKSENAIKYADFLLSKMTAEGKKNRLNAASYHIKDNMRDKSQIRMFIPGAGKYYQDHLRLNWEQPEASSGYRVEVFNMYQELVQAYDLHECMFDLYIDDELGEENILLIKVSSTDGEYESELLALKRLGSFQLEDVADGGESLSSVYYGKDAVSKLIMAGFFEHNNLLADALTCYLKAIEYAPDVPLYREAYEEFLLRNHLIRFQ